MLSNIPVVNLTSEYRRELMKKFEIALLRLSEKCGKMIHEKNLQQKISWHCAQSL
jgi:hypothetical protein